MAIKSRFPKQDECDPAEPDEHLLWGLTQIPMGQEMMPIELSVARTISKHLHELGFRHHPALQKKKLQMPHRGQQSYLNGMARWVDINESDPDPVILPNVKTMTTHEKALMVEELKNVGFIQDPPPDRGPVAQITSAKKLRRSDHVTKASDLEG